MAKTIETRLAELGITLPEVPTPMGRYVPAVISGNLLFLAGQGAKGRDGEWKRGRVGAEVGTREAYQHARLAGMRLLAAARAPLGSLDRVRRVVKVMGLVQATPEFREHPAVINGCSDLFVEVFGEAGRHARSAFGVASLPENTTVEIEAILEIE